MNTSRDWKKFSTVWDNMDWMSRQRSVALPWMKSSCLDIKWAKQASAQMRRRGLLFINGIPFKMSRKYRKYYSQITKPLYQLLEKDKVEWNDQVDRGHTTGTLNVWQRGHCHTGLYTTLQTLPAWKSICFEDLSQTTSLPEGNEGPLWSTWETADGHRRIWFHHTAHWWHTEHPGRFFESFGLWQAWRTNVIPKTDSK